MAKTSKFPEKKEVTVFKAQPKRIWSEYQKNIFKDIHSGTGNTMIIARAGSAKTTSLVEGSKYIPKGNKTLFCAFNKSIQEELKSRLSERIEALTLHSLGYRGIRQRFGNVELDNYKCQNIVSDFFDNQKENADLIDSICKTITFSKANLVDTPDKIEELIEYYDIDLCEIELKEFIPYVCKALRLCKEQTNVIDFNDMIWLPFVYRINVGKYDYVFIDEAHDLNKCQIELALSAVKPNGRVIACLDTRQAIYSWSGADHRVYENLKSRLSPKELTLPICYRCPKKVVELAQTLVPDILPYENNIDGEIIDLKLFDLIKTAKPGDYVLSRYNAPLIKSCMHFLKNKIPANILGRDIGDGLLYLIKKSKKKNVKSLLEWLGKWEKTEKANRLAKNPKASVDYITDKAECIVMLCDCASSIDEVKSNVKKMFQDNDEKKIVLHQSIHRCKGKETNDVFVLADTLSSSSEEELNLQYVSFTRAKRKLYLVRK